jgi:hypothetical protein
MRRAAVLILCASCARTPVPSSSIVSPGGDAAVAPDAAPNLLAEILSRHPELELDYDAKLPDEPLKGKTIRVFGRVSERRVSKTRSIIELVAPGTKTDSHLECELDPIESPPIAVEADAVLEGTLDLRLTFKNVPPGVPLAMGSSRLTIALQHCNVIEAKRRTFGITLKKLGLKLTSLDALLLQYANNPEATAAAWHGRKVAVRGRVSGPAANSDSIVLLTANLLSLPNSATCVGLALKHMRFYDDELLTVVAHVSDSPATDGGLLLVNCQPTDD